MPSLIALPLAFFTPLLRKRWAKEERQSMKKGKKGAQAEF